jgi:hypothetical protein
MARKRAKRLPRFHVLKIEPTPERIMRLPAWPQQYIFIDRMLARLNRRPFDRQRSDAALHTRNAPKAAALPHRSFHRNEDIARGVLARPRFVPASVRFLGKSFQGPTGRTKRHGWQQSCLKFSTADLEDYAGRHQQRRLDFSRGTEFTVGVAFVDLQHSIHDTERVLIWGK